MLVTGIALTPAYAVPNYPTAAEVAQAKRNANAKVAMVERIEGILDVLETEARGLEKIALQKNEAHNQAKRAADEIVFRLFASRA
jgi:hypothetical protein